MAMTQCTHIVVTMMLGYSRLVDSDAKVRLISPLAVVVGASTLALARQATAMFLLDNAATVIEGNTCVLLCAWIVRHRYHAFLVLYDLRVRASSAGVLLDILELLCL